MNLTVLIDLDDTLLSNNMETFLEVYLKGLGSAFSPYISPEKMIPQLLSATRMMTRKSSPALRLEELFDENFYAPLGLDKKALSAVVDSFYRDEFPKFKSVTSYRPDAVDLMGKIMSRGWDVVIATNPLFPQSAVHQRILWAGLEDFLPSIKIITSFEKFHFAKPNPAYYAEILGQMGWPEQPVVMIGNSLSDDVLSAAVLGMQVFWLNNNAEALPPSLDGNGKNGFMEDIFPWLEEIAAIGSILDVKDPRGMLAVLASTPAAMDSLCITLKENDWKRRPSEGEWSPAEIMCHLRDVDQDVNMTRLQIVIQQENPFIPAMDTDPWATERCYQAQNGRSALTDFIAKRSQLLEILKELPPEDWKKPARHAIFGPTTLLELVGIIISHDQAHLRQMIAAINI